MIVAVNISAFSKSSVLYQDLTIDFFEEIAKKHPSDEFLFITNKSFLNKATTLKNITTIFVDQGRKNIVFWQFWYDYKLAAILKKQKADLLISPNAACCLQSKIPQLLFLQDLTVLHSPEASNKMLFKFYKKYTGQFLQKAKNIATTSVFLQKKIVDNYKTDNNKIAIVDACVSKKFGPINLEEKELVKEKYTEGKEYFLYSGEVNAEKNLIILLKAFSFFKKRQKSNMQLIIVTKSIDNTEFEASLKTYKFREEVKLLKQISVEEQAKIMAAAYAFILPSVYDVYPIELVEAMKCGTPIIAGNIGAIAEICGDAVTYIDTENFEDIAAKMMLLFKDENKRNELIIKGNELAKKYSIDKTVEQLWQLIVKTTQA